jgi:hypothetical protein
MGKLLTNYYFIRVQNTANTPADTFQIYAFNGTVFRHIRFVAIPALTPLISSDLVPQFSIAPEDRSITSMAGEPGSGIGGLDAKKWA